jgi:general nucleoside transport system permease protein
MTAVDQFQPIDTAPKGSWAALGRSGQIAVLVVSSFVMFSVARAVSGQNDLTSAFTINKAMDAALPIMLVGLGGLMSERSGIVNIGLEGMMICGSWGAGFFGYHFGPWAALAGAFLCGAIGGALHALATVTFGVDHVVSGVAINLLAAGWARFLSASLFKGRGSGSETNSPGFDAKAGMPTIRVPGMKKDQFMASIERRHWPVISDAAGVIRGFLSEIELYQVVAIACVPLVAWLVWRTKFGLRLRSSGEKPSAADSLGVNVVVIRYQSVILSGGFAGLGGALLVLNVNGQYSEAQTNGRGFLGLAALIFGNWRPGGVVGGAGLFGYLSVLEDTTKPAAVRGLYLAVAVLLAVGAIVLWRRKRLIGCLTAGVGAVALLALFFGGVAIEKNLYNALPAIGTLVVLVVFSRRLRQPAAAGIPWRRGDIT